MNAEIVSNAPASEGKDIVETEPQTAGGRPSRRQATVFSSPAFHKLQRRHFILFDVLPAIGAAGVFVLSFYRPPTPADLALFGLFWLATGLGLTIGYHRYFAHHSYTATRPATSLLLVLGSMAARGPMISWVAMHRRHHERADREGDLHSPNLHGSGLRGWLHAHFVWMVQHDYPNVMHYAPDLLRDKQIARINRHYYWWIALGLALPALIGAGIGGLSGGSWGVAFEGGLTGFLWGGVLRLFVVEQTMSAINSFCHLVGSRRFPTREHSRNNAWLGILTWGEAHHNNHHAFSNSAAFGLKWYELDPGLWVIRLLQAFGLVSDVKVPTTAQVEQKAAGTESAQ
jgi:stearoyl-CoA desaturase (Delta-9 desaturase)